MEVTKGMSMVGGPMEFVLVRMIGWIRAVVAHKYLLVNGLQRRRSQSSASPFQDTA